MHLMYTMDEQGNRVYTLKVGIIFFSLFSLAHHTTTQKTTDAGRITKSAHPGAADPCASQSTSHLT